MVDITEIVVTINQLAGQRLDKALVANAPKECHLSRGRILELILSGQVRKEHEIIKNHKFKTSEGEVYVIMAPPPEKLDVEAEDIPLDIRYEDDDLLVVNKPVGMVVHPARGNHTGTLVNAILHHCDGQLSGIGGVERPGIVHRIDKDTSGLLVVAKNNAAHQGLSDQFREHSIERLYHAFAYGDLNLLSAPKMDGVSTVQGRIRVDLPIARHPRDRLRMAVRDDGKHAITFIEPIARDPSGAVTRVQCQLETGRTHQIRVHLSHIGFPLVGDPNYGRGTRSLRSDTDPELRDAIDGLVGQALHAGVLGFIHPISGKALRFEAELPPELQHIADLMA